MVRRFLGRIAVAATSFSGGSLFAQNLTPTTCSSGIPSIAGCPLCGPGFRAKQYCPDPVRQRQRAAALAAVERFFK